MRLKVDIQHVNCISRYQQCTVRSQYLIQYILYSRCSIAKLCPILWDSVDCSTPGSLSFTISWSLLKLVSIESVMLFNHLMFCQPLFLLPSIFPSIRLFYSELALHIRWPKYWSFSLSISPSNEYSGLISFSSHWFDLLAVQATLKSLLHTTI